LKELDDLIREMEDYLAAMDTEQAKNDDVFGGVQNVTTEQIELALKMMRAPPNEQRIKKIVHKLDADGDGRVFMKEILELAQELGVDPASTKSNGGEKPSVSGEKSTKT
jgi:LETM1 and EF-hand domain-containing protein 1